MATSSLTQKTDNFRASLIFYSLRHYRLVGGNAVGIFIHSVDAESAAYHAGLRGADQILEYNGIDLRQATAEQAAYELAKPAEKVTLLVQYNPDSKYIMAQGKVLPREKFYPEKKSTPEKIHSFDPIQLILEKLKVLMR